MVVPSKSKVPLQRDDQDVALWDHARAAAWIATVTEGGVSPEDVLPHAGSGLDLCRTAEPEIYRRVRCSLAAAAAEGGDDNERGARADALARRIYSGLWTLICDAKTRKRKPNGMLLSAEQEAADVARAEKAQADKAALWAEREKHLRSEH